MKLSGLVTGGAGYIGSHTCKTLSSAGFHPPLSGGSMTEACAFAAISGEPFEPAEDFVDKIEAEEMVFRPPTNI